MIVPRRKLVLVVDDEPEILDVATFVLEDEGYAVRTASDGQQALSLVSEQTPDLILLDMRMPVLDGWGFAREYRSRYDQRAPIVVLTAAASAAKRAEEVGAIGYLEKPFELDALVGIVRRAVPPS